MNIFEKLNAARIKIAEKGLSKTGSNTFAGFKYFELSEILPIVTKVNAELKLFSAFSFLRDTATLEIVNAEKTDEKVTFSFAYSPDGATLKACHKIQNEGAVQTYIKRYLYQNAYEIAEADQLDATCGRDEQKPSRTAPKAQQGAKPQQQNPRKSFEETIAEVAEKHPEEVTEELGKHGYESASEIVERQAQVKFYADLMNNINSKSTGV